ncbi:MAG: hypothetical protein AB7K68_09800 [Bacteriovoracia bacterium]
MNKAIFVMTLCSALSLPALAHKDDAACVPSNSTTGENVYYTPTTKVTKAKARPQRSAAEQRRIWLRDHTPSGMILGSMANAPGNSAIAYLHGTATPQSHVVMDNDEGPSARPDGWNRTSASDTSEDEF